MSSKALAWLLLVHFIFLDAHVDGQVSFHVINKCPFRVWPAAAPNTGHPVIADGGGFLLQPGQGKQVKAPPTWSGRLWAAPGAVSVRVRVRVRVRAQNLQVAKLVTVKACFPAMALLGCLQPLLWRLKHVSLQEDKSKPSFYDVSLVDGYNLPIAVSTRAADRNCLINGCTKSPNSVCPRELSVTDGSGGAVVACKSACLAFDLDVFCCRNSYGTPETCKPTMYSKMFKDACPSYFSYAYDSPLL
uniref:Thaumatin-like protein n=1 Tax=Ananas comosus var. bracteatus TaxID=296719 RepID=A0A6V7NVP4_ANACO|nr:unnamed protein product [Ananas comosus var. bracteatus]